MAARIVQEIEGKENVILGGDFNTVPDTRTIVSIEDHLRNVTKDVSKTTFNVRRKKDPIFGNLTVDMIFVSKNLHVVESRVPDIDVSDHLPLIVVISTL